MNRVSFKLSRWWTFIVVTLAKDDILLLLTPFLIVSLIPVSVLKIGVMKQITSKAARPPTGPMTDHTADYMVTSMNIDFFPWGKKKDSQKTCIIL